MTWQSLNDTIICFGDSLTSGMGADPGMDYPSQLSKMIAKPVINAGVPGDTTAKALKRLQRDVLSESIRYEVNFRPCRPTFILQN